MFRRANKQTYRAFEQPISQLHGIAYGPVEDVDVHGCRDSQNHFVFNDQDMVEVLNAAHHGGHEQARRELALAAPAPAPAPPAPSQAPAGAEEGRNAAAREPRYEAVKLFLACAAAGCALTEATLGAVPDLKSDCSASGVAVGCSLKHGMALGQVIAAGVAAAGAWTGAAAEFIRIISPRLARDRYESWKLAVVCLGAGCALAGATLGAVPALKADCGARGAAIGCGLAHQMAIGKVVAAAVGATVAFAGAGFETARAIWQPSWMEGKPHTGSREAQSSHTS